MHIAEVVTIAKSLPLLRLNTYKSLILSYSADYRRIFKEEARRLKEAFCFERDADDFDYLNHQLQSVKNLLVGLKLPWIQIAPILYRCMAVYLQRPDQHVSNMKVRYLSTQLMDGVLLLSQNGRLINDLLMFFDRQLKDIQRLREEKCEEMENVRL